MSLIWQLVARRCWLWMIILMFVPMTLWCCYVASQRCGLYEVGSVASVDQRRGTDLAAMLACDLVDCLTVWSRSLCCSDRNKCRPDGWNDKPRYRRRLLHACRSSSTADCVPRNGLVASGWLTLAARVACSAVCANGDRRKDGQLLGVHTSSHCYHVID